MGAKVIQIIKKFKLRIIFPIQKSLKKAVLLFKNLKVIKVIKVIKMMKIINLLKLRKVKYKIIQIYRPK